MLRQTVNNAVLSEDLEVTSNGNGHSNGKSNGHHKNGHNGKLDSETQLFPKNSGPRIMQDHLVAALAYQVRQYLYDFIHTNMRETAPLGWHSQGGEPARVDGVVRMCNEAVLRLEPLIHSMEDSPEGVQIQILANAMQSKLEELLIYLNGQGVSHGIAENSRHGVMTQLASYKESFSLLMIQVRAMMLGIQVH